MNGSWKSWREEYSEGDVLGALVFVGLEGWTHDTWSDGDMQFVKEGAKATFDELAKLRVTFTPLRMTIEALDNDEIVDGHALVVTMSWNKVSDPDAV